VNLPEYGSGNFQCYTRNNVRVSRGSLIIEARNERMSDLNGQRDYTSGRIRQKGSGFKYGAYVIRARMPRGDHLWAALWTLPINNQCRYEEIDIAEYRGQQNEVNNVEMAAHWGRGWDALTSKGKKVLTSTDLSADFHEYAVLWLPTKLEYYIDRILRYTIRLNDGHFTKDSSKRPCRGSNQPFDEPTNFIFNLAVGGPFFQGWPPMNSKTWTKPTFEIDWVRVYQA